MIDLRQIEYVVFDVETTGLFPTGGDRIIEIAAIKVKNKKTIDQISSLIHPQRSIPEEVQKIHKINDEMVSDAPSAEEFLPKVLSFIGGGCLVAHNIKFDLDFLCYELAGIGRNLHDSTPTLDTLKMAKQYLPQLSNHKLSNLARYFGVKFEETHRALADVAITVSVFQYLLDLARSQGMDDIQEVFRNFSVPKPNFKINETVSQNLLF